MAKRKGKDNPVSNQVDPASGDRGRNTPPESPAQKPPAKKRTAPAKPVAKPAKKAPTKPAAPAEKPKRGRPVAEDLSNRCTATSRTSGEQCRQAAIAGGRVCRYHGGATPQVQRSARGRLAELVMPAINTLNHEREHAKRSADRQRAANSILDRAGITRGHSAEVDAARALLLERLLSLRAEAVAPGVDALELVATVIPDDDEDAEYGDADERDDSGA